MVRWKAHSGGILGGGLLPYPPLAQAFTGRLTEWAHMFVFLEWLALTFRLIITHNQHQCSHYISIFLLRLVICFVFYAFCLCEAYVRFNKMLIGNHYKFPIFLHIYSEQHRLVIHFHECFLWNILFKLPYRITGACMSYMGGTSRIKPLTPAYSSGRFTVAERSCRLRQTWWS